MARKLTKPQARLIARAMHCTQGIVPKGSEIRTAETLRFRKGYFDGIGRVFWVTREGLDALLHDRKLDDWKSGSVATMAAVASVESAIKELEGKAA